jgi:hypothetical protein
MTTRRRKNYAAQTGYGYDYYFVGQRAALAGAPAGAVTEFVFDVSADRKTTYAVSVFLCAEALESWAARHGRSLAAAEQYAAAKLRLLAGLDEIESLAAHSRQLLIDATMIEELLGPLGLE